MQAGHLELFVEDDGVEVFGLHTYFGLGHISSLAKLAPQGVEDDFHGLPKALVVLDVVGVELDAFVFEVFVDKLVLLFVGHTILQTHNTHTDKSSTTN